MAFDAAVGVGDGGGDFGEGGAGGDQTAAAPPAHEEILDEYVLSGMTGRKTLPEGEPSDLEEIDPVVKSAPAQPGDLIQPVFSGREPLADMVEVGGAVKIGAAPGG